MKKQRPGSLVHAWLLLTLVSAGACETERVDQAPAQPAVNARPPASEGEAMDPGAQQPTPAGQAPATDGQAPSAAGGSPEETPSDPEPTAGAGGGMPAAAGAPAVDDGRGSGGAATATPTAGSCCDAAEDSGCAKDPEVERCVCAKDPECCSGAWDAFCALLVATETANGTCGTCP
jgi:hypothetical protein